jgi:hypothetical protein
MKKIITILVLSLLVISCNDKPANKIKKENLELAKKRDSKIKLGGAKMKFDKTEHDFGTINEGDVVETIFKFTNSGKSELIITSAKASCGCTIPEWPKEPIMPGESGEIKVKFNSRRKPNLQQKRVTLVTNTPEGKEIIKIRAMVIPEKKVK